MEIKPYLNIIIKKLWIVILTPLLVAAATFLGSLYFFEPVYEASMTLFVMNKIPDAGPTYDDILASQQLIKDCREIIKSKSITKAVVEQLNLQNLSADDLANMITVNLKNDTRIMEIKVRDTNKVRAKKITDKLGMLFKNKAKDLMILETLEIVDKADIPHKPVAPRPLVYMLITFIVAMFLVLGVIFVLEYLDDTFKIPEDVEKHLGLTVIAVIPSLDME